MDANTSRLESFSDGVFAVAITLPVLQITVPEVESGHRARHRGRRGHARRGDDAHGSQLRRAVDLRGPASTAAAAGR
ncbi:TMEM175 family protein [Gandjariella thermophila]|uniref:TMEM175 family protein n=1 Tax=Gandjariella thermophila TaxID=1931992 RepID=UPI0010F99E1D